MASKAILQQNLNNLIEYLKPFLSFVNCHMVNYLTEDHWNNFIPETIKNEFKDLNVSENDVYDLFWSGDKSWGGFRNLGNFIDVSKEVFNNNFKNICLERDELNKFLNQNLGFELNAEFNSRLEISEFLTSKKKHEVEIASSVIANLCTNKTSNFFVIDAGDGKGYLSSRLALEFNIKVLGIDANEINTESAERRVIKLAKAWNGLNKRAEDVSNGITPPRRGKRKKNTINKESIQNENYRTTTNFITSHTDLQKLVKENFPNENPEKFILSGLHTCGNLASDCLRIFALNNQVHILMNIGCCYHLLREEFIQDKFFNDKKFYSEKFEELQSPGFPMSDFLKEKNFILGRNARMLASQSIHRTVSSKELPNSTLFYRSLLEVLLTNQDPKLANIIQVGKIKCTSFIEYVRKCSSKHNLNLENLSDTYLIDFESDYERHKHLLNIFYLIRQSFACILESIILLDRLLYLRERDIENVFLCQLFEPIISPRCYGIIGIK